MRNKGIIVFLRLAVMWLLLFSGLSAQGKELVYRVDVRDEIGAKTWRLARKAFTEAKRLGADKIKKAWLDIDEKKIVLRVNLK